MKYYKNDITGDVYAYENDGSQDDSILPELRQMTAAEVHAHLNPPPAPPRVPEKITRAQGRLVLYRAGLWPAVLTFVAGIADPDEQFEADAALNHTTEWERSSPFLCRTAQALGLDDAQLDALFREAAQIVP
ncbi:hypothetical protein ACFO3A_12750 [Comamonas nitrativorans]|uniref:Uncharacterized protein n=1 Tax=Comamonas nitrativorans TaxID=108437 RepID=A0ABV9GZU1_9BURK